jgi:hypothetical protein
VAAKMANLKNGEQKRNAPQICGASSTEDAATLLNVSSRSVESAKHVLANGSQALIEAIESMALTVSLAEKLCKACKDKREQAALVREGKQAIREYLTPMPDESEETDEEDHDYDYPIVKAFAHADYRVNTIRKLLATLSKTEIAELGIKITKPKDSIDTNDKIGVNFESLL